MRLAVLTISDRCSQGLLEDTAGPAVIRILEQEWQQAEILARTLADDEDAIAQELEELSNAGMALVLTVGTSWEWNLNTGGRPIASITPYIVIIFEMMILFGVLGAVTSFFIKSGLPSFDSATGYRTRFGADRFGLVVRTAESDSAKIESLMREAGAEEVVREAA